MDIPHPKWPKLVRRWVNWIFRAENFSRKMTEKRYLSQILIFSWSLILIGSLQNRDWRMHDQECTLGMHLKSNSRFRIWWNSESFASGYFVTKNLRLHDHLKKFLEIFSRSSSNIRSKYILHSILFRNSDLWAVYGIRLQVPMNMRRLILMVILAL